MPPGKVSSKDPRIQAAIEARRSREASRKKSKSKSTKRKGPSLGSGMAEKARKAISGRGKQINKAVNKALGK